MTWRHVRGTAETRPAAPTARRVVNMVMADWCGRCRWRCCVDVVLAGHSKANGMLVVNKSSATRLEPDDLYISQVCQFTIRVCRTMISDMAICIRAAPRNMRR